jgi:hypothetical protein
MGGPQRKRPQRGESWGRRPGCAAQGRRHGSITRHRRPRRARCARSLRQKEAAPEIPVARLVKRVLTSLYTGRNAATELSFRVFDGVLSGHRESRVCFEGRGMDRLYLSITVSATYTLVAMALIITFMR